MFEEEDSCKKQEIYQRYMTVSRSTRKRFFPFLILVPTLYPYQLEHAYEVANDSYKNWAQNTALRKNVLQKAIHFFKENEGIPPEKCGFTTLRKIGQKTRACPTFNVGHALVFNSDKL